MARRALMRGVLLGVFLLVFASSNSSAFARGPATTISAVKLVEGDGGATEVVVRTDAEPSFTARVEQGGRRLVIDLSDASAKLSEPAITEPRGVVGGVMTQEFLAEGRTTTRVLVQLAGSATYRIAATSEGLRVRLVPADKTRPASAKDEPTPRGNEPSALVQLNDVRFDRGVNQDRVVLALSGSPKFSTVERSETRTLLVLDGVAVANSLVRTLDVGAFGGLVHAVSTYRKDGTIVVDVDHDPLAAGVVVPQTSALHFVFTKGSPDAMLTGVAKDGGVARRTKVLSSDGGASLVPFGDAIASAPGVANERQTNEEWQSEPDQAGAFPVTPLQLDDRRNRPATRRVDLDLKDADIHNVFRILADVGNVNIVAADNIAGAVTIRMKNVPWDEALETILRAKKLGMERRGNIVRIALAADLAAERELKIKELRSRLQLEPLEVRLIPVSYATANDMATRAKEMVSPRGSLTVDPRTNVIVAQDVAGNLNRIEELIRALDTQTPQVLIEARIVEATSRFQRDVGIQWGGDVAFSPGTGNETGTAFPSSIGLVGGASDPNSPTGGLSPRINSVTNPNFAVNLPATVGTGAGGALGLTLGSIDNTVNLAVRLSAAESTGMLRVVSSPRVLALDNHEARIVQGTLIPFSQVSAQGVQTVFQEARLQLLVVPHVTADGSVAMHVRVNRDEPDFNQTSARGDPTILRREAETELIVRDGHTAVIGGIYTRNTGRNVDSIPVLGDIPVIGMLFQRRRASDSRSELVIFLTPRIVNRAEALGR